ncbi:unnamed protein product [Moneuplotes crassus]|uniref:Uncharacterized protein n=1 Tax=Euplotes crassus TaxID=5936 RepID=A0AAD1Y611_EUPCR|nr:unnamed protein product [Moneuplotes crassus]
MTEYPQEVSQQKVFSLINETIQHVLDSGVQDHILIKEVDSKKSAFTIDKILNIFSDLGQLGHFKDDPSKRLEIKEDFEDPEEPPCCAKDSLCCGSITTKKVLNLQPGIDKKQGKMDRSFGKTSKSSSFSHKTGIKRRLSTIKKSKTDKINDSMDLQQEEVFVPKQIDDLPKQVYNDSIDETTLENLRVYVEKRKRDQQRLQAINNRNKKKRTKLQLGLKTPNFSKIQESHCLDEDTFVKVKNLNGNKLPKLTQESYANVAIENSPTEKEEVSSSSETEKSYDFFEAERPQFAEEEPEKQETKEIYQIDKEYTRKQDISDCFLGLRKYIECNYGVTYQEQKSKLDLEEEINGKKSDISQEDAPGFSMGGKPYREKFNNTRLTKQEYNQRYNDYSSSDYNLAFPGNSEIKKQKYTINKKDSPSRKRPNLSRKGVLSPYNPLKKGFFRRKLTYSESKSGNADIRSMMDLSIGSKNVQLPKVIHNAERATEILDLKVRRSTRTNLGQNNKSTDGLISAQKESIQNLVNEAKKGLIPPAFMRTKGEYNSSVHDKFHDSIRNDENWGKAPNSFKDKKMIANTRSYDNYRKIRNLSESFNKNDIKGNYMTRPGLNSSSISISGRLKDPYGESKKIDSKRLSTLSLNDRSLNLSISKKNSSRAKLRVSKNISRKGDISHQRFTSKRKEILRNPYKNVNEAS